MLDNSLYAIKKLKIKIKRKNKDFENEILKVFQEIRFLAKIKGEHIVDYNHSWVEVNLKEDKYEENPKTNILTEKDFDFKNCKINDFDQDEENDDIIFYDANYQSYNKEKGNKSNEIILQSGLKNKNNSYKKNSTEGNSSLNIEKSGNTKTDSSDYSLESSSKNRSLDVITNNNNSLDEIYGFKNKIQNGKNDRDFLDNSDEEEFENNNNKKTKKYSMHMPSFQLCNKTNSWKKKSTICIKNKEYL